MHAHADQGHRSFEAHIIGWEEDWRASAITPLGKAAASYLPRERRTSGTPGARVFWAVLACLPRRQAHFAFACLAC